MSGKYLSLKFVFNVPVNGICRSCYLLRLSSLIILVRCGLGLLEAKLDTPLAPSEYTLYTSVDGSA
jgi:hypothetical protein